MGSNSAPEFVPIAVSTAAVLPISGTIAACADISSSNSLVIVSSNVGMVVVVVVVDAVLLTSSHCVVRMGLWPVEEENARNPTKDDVAVNV